MKQSHYNRLALERTGRDVPALLKARVAQQPTTAAEAGAYLSDQLQEPFPVGLVYYNAARHDLPLVPAPVGRPPDRTGRGRHQRALVELMTPYLRLLGQQADYDHVIGLLARLPDRRSSPHALGLLAAHGGLSQAGQKQIRQRLHDDLAIERYYLHGLPVPTTQSVGRALHRQTEAAYHRLMAADEPAAMLPVGAGTLLVLPSGSGILIYGERMRLVRPARVHSMIYDEIIVARRTLRQLEETLVSLTQKGVFHVHDSR